MDRLLDLIEKRFWPSDIALLNLRLERVRKRPADDRRHQRLEQLLRRSRMSAQDSRDSMDRIVEGWLIRGDYPFMALSWLDATSEKTCTTYSEFAERKELSPYLSHWLGQQLLARWQLSANAQETRDERAREGALVALEHAKRIEQPDVLLEVADELRDLGETHESERLYVRAAHASEEPRQLTMVAGRLEEAGRFAEALEFYRRAHELEPADAAQRRNSYGFYSGAVGVNLFAPGNFRQAHEAFAAAGGSGGERISWRDRVAQRLLSEGAIATRDAHLHLRSLLGAAQRASLEERRRERGNRRGHRGGRACGPRVRDADVETSGRTTTRTPSRGTRSRGR